MQIADKQELNATERFGAVFVFSEFSIYGIEEVATYHGYLIDNEEIESLDDVLLVLADFIV